jgi:hypothetical protein
MAATVEQDRWVARVLGHQRPGVAGSAPTGLEPASEALRRDLTGLIRRIPATAGADGARKAALAKLATNAEAAIKANDLTAAAAAVAQLREVLNDRGAKTSKTLPIWQAAKDRANEEIGKLQDALRATRYPLFERIADQGLNGITGRLQVGLQTALMNLDDANGPARADAGVKARQALADFRAFLDSDPLLPLLEENPLGVNITLRMTLPEALDQIEKALAS